MIKKKTGMWHNILRKSYLSMLGSTNFCFHVTKSKKRVICDTVIFNWFLFHTIPLVSIRLCLVTLHHKRIQWFKWLLSEIFFECFYFLFSSDEPKGSASLAVILGIPIATIIITPTRMLQLKIRFFILDISPFLFYCFIDNWWGKLNQCRRLSKSHRFINKCFKRLNRTS